MIFHQGAHYQLLPERQAIPTGLKYSLVAKITMVPEWHRKDMMDGNRVNELRELVELLSANEIAEFDMEQGDLKIRIKFAVEPAATNPANAFDITQLSRLIASTPTVAPAPTVAIPSVPVVAA